MAKTRPSLIDAQPGEKINIVANGKKFPGVITEDLRLKKKIKLDYGQEFVIDIIHLERRKVIQ